MSSAPFLLLTVAHLSSEVPQALEALPFRQELCWEAGYHYNLCCATRVYGPQGNPDCWHGSYNFSSCCDNIKAVNERSGWAEGIPGSVVSGAQTSVHRTFVDHNCATLQGDLDPFTGEARKWVEFQKFAWAGLESDIRSLGIMASYWGPRMLDEMCFDESGSGCSQPRALCPMGQFSVLLITAMACLGGFPDMIADSGVPGFRPMISGIREFVLLTC